MSCVRILFLCDELQNNVCQPLASERLTIIVVNIQSKIKRTIFMISSTLHRMADVLSSRLRTGVK